MLIKFVGDIYPPWGLSLYQDPPSLYLTKVIVTTVTYEPELDITLSESNIFYQSISFTFEDMRV